MPVLQEGERMSEAFIAAKDLLVKRSDQVILDKVSLNIERGDFVTLIGPNGAGKSTLLKCLLGIVKPDAGEVSRSAGVRIGYVPQRLQVEAIMPLRVRRFLMLGQSIQQAVLKETCVQMGLEKLLDRMMSELSGGELQRVLLARALLRKPDLLVLDEPAQNLDVSGQLEFYALIEKQHRDTGVGVLMVSHDLHLVMAATRRVLCLNGHVCCEGDAEDVSRNPAFVSLFGEDMAHLVRVYHHHHDHTCEGGHHHNV